MLNPFHYSVYFDIRILYMLNKNEHFYNDFVLMEQEQGNENARAQSKEKDENVKKDC